jgi:hypothetical protein
LKLLQERERNTLEHIGIGNNFQNGVSMAQQIREREDKCGYIKLKSFFTEKATVTRLMTAYRKGENLSAIHLIRD